MIPADEMRAADDLRAADKAVRYVKDLLERNPRFYEQSTATQRMTTVAYPMSEAGMAAVRRAGYEVRICDNQTIIKW